MQVGATAASITSVCPVGSTTFCAKIIVSQTEQCLPSVKPVSVQVGATAASITSVCPSGATFFCSTIVVLHTLQCFPSDSPDAMQVGAKPVSVISVWSNLGTFTFCVFLQSVQVFLVIPSFVQVAATRVFSS